MCGSDLGRSRTHALWEPARVNSLRLRAAARTARLCGESLLELAFQAVGREVMFCDNLHRALEPDPRGLKGEDLHVVGDVLPVRMVIALAFFGPEGFEEALAELSREEIAAVFGEAVDALMDAETKHEKEMRKLAERLQR
jgi:hypothetical protein